MTAATETSLQAEPPALCPNCCKGNAVAGHFCTRCGAPLSSMATMDPLWSVWAEGYMVRKAVHRPRSWMTLVGMWLIFAPQVVLIVSSWLDVMSTALRAPGGAQLPVVVKWWSCWCSTRPCWCCWGRFSSSRPATTAVVWEMRRPLRPNSEIPTVRIEGDSSSLGWLSNVPTDMLSEWSAARQSTCAVLTPDS